MQRQLVRVFVLLVFVLAFSTAHRGAAQDSAEPDANPDVAAEKTPLRREKSPLPSEPKTPLQLFDAVSLLADLGRPELAKLYLDKLMATLDDATLLKIRDERGPAEFLKLSNIKELQPQSVELLNRANAVFVKATNDPGRLEKLIADLRKGGGTRAMALDQLRLAGVAAIPTILAAIVDRDNADIYDK